MKSTKSVSTRDETDYYRDYFDAKAKALKRYHASVAVAAKKLEKGKLRLKLLRKA